MNATYVLSERANLEETWAVKYRLKGIDESPHIIILQHQLRRERGAGYSRINDQIVDTTKY